MQLTPRHYSVCIRHVCASRSYAFGINLTAAIKQAVHLPVYAFFRKASAHAQCLMPQYSACVQLPSACLAAFPSRGLQRQRVSDEGSSTSGGSMFNDMAAWIADSLQWPGQLSAVLHCAMPKCSSSAYPGCLMSGCTRHHPGLAVHAEAAG